MSSERKPRQKKKNTADNEKWKLVQKNPNVISFFQETLVNYY